MCFIWLRVARPAVWSGESPSLQPFQFFQPLYPRNHPRGCCDGFPGFLEMMPGPTDVRISIIDRFECIGNECRRIGMPMGRRLELGTARTVAAQSKQHSIQKTIQIIQMMAPREEPFSAALSTPTTHPDPRPINSYTIRVDCKRGRGLLYFISRYRLPAHLGPSVGMPVDLFCPDKNSHFRFSHRPSLLLLRLPPPPLSRGRHRPSLRCTPSRT